jgi:hypothetical protein
MIRRGDCLRDHELPTHKHDHDDAEHENEVDGCHLKAMAAVKFAPVRKIDRAIATAAYEQDEEAAPSASAMLIERGLSSGRRRLNSRCETIA